MKRRRREGACPLTTIMGIYRTTIRDRTFFRVTRAVRAFQKQPSLSRALTVCSYWGWFTHSDSRKAIARHQIKEAFTEARAIISEHERATNASH